ncbi:NADH-quinone oxidoreductase subunit 12 [bacterium BMS3Bbin02]|nr:NADH-quinone oxidoreductase subunit 12 [bacterium BMS3Bbin02]
MIDFIWLVIALPLFGAVGLLFFGKRIGEPNSGRIGSALVVLSFFIALVAALPAFAGTLEPENVLLFEWLPALGVNVSLLWDPLSAMMTLIVTGVGALIHIYGTGYMHGDSRFPRFFTYLNLFIASMLILVLGDSFATMFVGWELVGLSSYLLISFWFEKPSAAAAGKKAFIVNRIGDFGFLIGLMIIFATFGSLSYSTVFANANILETGGATVTAITLLLLVGAVGKSAQLPLSVWLPDAMEGPTPVSALIHAATMVTAGVYMIARSAALFSIAPVSSGVVATVGALTALFAAVVAIGQRDIKRVLAYSTISQLGYMFMAVGATAYVAGVFHLMTHAFFKALLFLGAGAVIHGMHGEQDMWKMGGLRKKMPITFVTMLVAWMAISGIPPFAGFWSKDEILAITYGKGGAWVVLWAIGIVTAGLTAFYMSRLMFLTFWGKPRWDDGLEPHESPRSMTLPLAVLAVFAAGAGLINTPFRLSLEHFLDPVFEVIKVAHPPEGSTPWILAGVSVLVALGGIAYAYRRYIKRALPVEEGPRWDFLEEGFGVDELYGRTIVLPGKAVAESAAFTADARGIDGLVNGVGGAVKKLADAATRLQTGQVRSYGTGMFLGTVALILWLLVRGGAF